MAGGFAFRLLDVPSYESVCRDLDRFAQGDPAARRSLIERCRRVFASPEFVRFHQSASYVVDYWKRLVRDACDPSAQVSLDEVVSMAIALCSMPLFQSSYLAAQETSPNLVLLAESDGGLYGLMADASEWFDHLLMRNWRGERYGFQSMMILQAPEVRMLADVADSLVLPAASAADCITARERLIDLARRALASDATTIAVSGVE